jgi:hypothetical protein
MAPISKRPARPAAGGSKRPARPAARPAQLVEVSVRLVLQLDLQVKQVTLNYEKKTRGFVQKYVA